MLSHQAWRTAELRGAAAARTLQDRLGIRQSLRGGERPVDVFSAIHQCGMTLLFQPLKSLLGAYITYRHARGLIVTTRRDLHIQRFTAAHELGHAELDHPTTSLDSEVGFAGRGPIPGSGSSDHDVREVEADAFAAEFLLPKWLVVAHIKRQGWSARQIQKADAVYQLSLRLGVSYSATCWSLASNNLVPRNIVQKLVEIQPRESKAKALAGSPPETWRDTDVWVLTERDEGAQIVGAPKDRLVIHLNERAAAGFLWQIDQPGASTLKLETNERNLAEPNEKVIGGPVRHTFVLTGETRTHLTFSERRPWEPQAATAKKFAVDLELLGPEPLGLPRATRRTLS